MKIIIFLVLVSHFVFGQAGKMSFLGSNPTYELKTPVGTGFEHNFQSAGVGTYVSNLAGWIQTNTNNSLTIFANSNIYDSRLLVDVNEDIRLTTMIKLGSDAPAIKMVEYTGITASGTGQGTAVTITENPNNIVSLRAVVDCGPAGYVSEEYKFSAGYQFSVFSEGDKIWIFNSDFNSNFILLKPFKLFVTYKK
jgi:hypothetical protein